MCVFLQESLTGFYLQNELASIFHDTLPPTGWRWISFVRLVSCEQTMSMPNNRQKTDWLFSLHKRARGIFLLAGVMLVNILLLRIEFTVIRVNSDSKSI